MSGDPQPQDSPSAASSRVRARLATTLVHPWLARRGQAAPRGSAPAIERSATYRIDEAADRAMVEGVGARDVDFYGRYGGATVRHAQDLLATLEGSEAAVMFASGIAAIATTMFALVPAGGRIVAARGLYGTTEAVLANELVERGVRIARFDAADVDGARRALEVPADLVWCEAIANPRLDVAPLPALCEVARAAGVRLAVDSTFAAGMATRPLEHGAHVVVHSATKFLNGHSDVIAGVACTDAPTADRIHARMTRLGACADPEAAWLLMRGLRTLPLRWARQVESAAMIAGRLAGHPAVARVLYPGCDEQGRPRPLPSHLRDGGAVLTFELRDAAAVARAVARLEVITHATSLGGLESLASVPVRSSHARVSAEERQRAGISDAMIRLSVGVEDVEDLWSDLEHALASLPTA